MILNTGFDAFVESIVMDDPLVNELRDATTIVNPKFPYYSDKIIIVSMPIDLKILKNCISNRCKILSRFPLDVDFQYLMKPYPESIDIEFKFLGNSLESYNKDYYRPIRCLRQEDSVYMYDSPHWDDLKVNDFYTMLGFVKSICKRV